MKNRTKLLFGLIFVFAFILRLIASFKQELWVDEAFSIYAIKYYQFPYDVIHPPLYYIFLKFWAIFSLKIIWLRLMSLIFSLFGLIYCFKLSKLLLDEKYALISTFLLSISSFDIHFSWQIRMYSLFFLLVSTSLYYSLFIIRQLNRNEIIKTRPLLLLFLINLLGSLVHYGFALYLLCWAVSFFLFFCKRGIPFFLKQKQLLIFFLAHLSLLLVLYLFLNNHSGDITSGIRWINPLGSRQLLTIILTIGNAAELVFPGKIPSLITIGAVLAILVISIFGLLKLKNISLFLFSLSITSIFLPLILAIVFQAIFNLSFALPRIFGFIHLFFELTVGLSLYYSLKKWPKAKSFLLTIFSTLLVLLFLDIRSNLLINFQSYYLGQGYRESVLFLKKKLNPQDQLIILPTYFSHLFWYHSGAGGPIEGNFWLPTKTIERNLQAKELTLKRVLGNQKGDLFVLVNYKSILTTNERRLIQELTANSCQLMKIGQDTQLIFCPKTVLKSFLLTFPKRTPGQVLNTVL